MIPVHCRWMIRRDMPSVLSIEERSFEYPWTEEEFIRCLRQLNCIGVCAEHDEAVIGFMIYEIHKQRLFLLRLAVNPDFRHQGIGRQMVEKLVGKLVYQRRNRIVCEVRETNLDAQLFFKACGFRAIGVLRDFYEQTHEDAYQMQYRVAVEAEKCEA